MPERSEHPLVTFLFCLVLAAIVVAGALALLPDAASKGSRQSNASSSQLNGH